MIKFLSKQIYAGDYKDAEDAAVVVVTAGAGQKLGETRLDLVKKNAGIFKSIIPEIAKYNKDGINQLFCCILISFGHLEKKSFKMAFYKITFG